SEPDLKMAIAGKAARGLEFCLQGRQGRCGDTLVARGPGALRTQGVVQTTLGIGPKPRSDARPMHPKQCGNLLAVARWAAGGQIQGMEPLALLEVRLAFHAALQLGGIFGDPWHRVAHLRSPPLDGWATEKHNRNMYSC